MDRQNAGVFAPLTCFSLPSASVLEMPPRLETGNGLFQLMMMFGSEAEFLIPARCSTSRAVEVDDMEGRAGLLGRGAAGGWCRAEATPDEVSVDDVRAFLDSWDTDAIFGRVLLWLGGGLGEGGGVGTVSSRHHAKY